MRRFVLILFCVAAFMAMRVAAGTYTLVDGTKIDGDPISMNDNGVLFRTADGSDVPRVIWDKFTQDSIRQLYAEAKTLREKTLIEPLVEEQPKEKAERKEITVKPIQPPDRPTTGLGIMAIFGSPVGIMILFVLYCANIFAAYEVAIYRRQPMATVCGLAAIPFFGVLSPIIFIAMPTRTASLDGVETQQTRFRETPPPSDAAAHVEVTAPPPEDVAATYSAPAYEAAAPAAQAAPALPEPIVFKRGDFSFNRRFFETKLAGFFRLVPGEAEKDMVIHLKTARGDYTGKRITNITPTDLRLQVFHNNATADETIPFIDILEVQVRHKDIA